MEDLYRRLPRLVQNRRAWSDAPARAYPTTLRLTVRSLCDSSSASVVVAKRRPFVTKSKQAPMNGAAVFVLQPRDFSRQSDQLRQVVQPLLQSLVLSSSSSPAASINVTRINLAVANFCDVPDPPPCKALKTFPRQHPHEHTWSSTVSREGGREAKKGLDTTRRSAFKRKKRKITEFFAPKKKGRLPGQSD